MYCPLPRIPLAICTAMVISPHQEMGNAGEIIGVVTLDRMAVVNPRAKKRVTHSVVTTGPCWCLHAEYPRMGGFMRVWATAPHCWLARGMASRVWQSRDLDMDFSAATPALRICNGERHAERQRTKANQATQRGNAAAMWGRGPPTKTHGRPSPACAVTRQCTQFRGQQQGVCLG